MTDSNSRRIAVARELILLLGSILIGATCAAALTPTLVRNAPTAEANLERFLERDREIDPSIPAERVEILGTLLDELDASGRRTLVVSPPVHPRLALARRQPPSETTIAAFSALHLLPTVPRHRSTPGSAAARSRYPDQLRRWLCPLLSVAHE